MLWADYDVVDGDVNQLDEKSDETHDGESNGRGHGDLLELFPIRLGASFDQADRVLAELFEGVQGNHNLIHC